MKLTTGQFTSLFGVLFVVSCATSILTFGVGPGPIELDASHYWNWADETVSGDWLQLNNRIDCRTPGYPVVLGLYQTVFGGSALKWLVVSQHILVVLTDMLLAYIAWQMTASRAAVLVCYGGAAVSLMRPWFANLVCPETLFLFVFMAAIAALSAYHRSPAVWRSVLFGGLLGLSILIRPVPKLLWIPLVGLFCIHCTSWVESRRTPREIARHALAGLFVLTIVLAPWMARNWVVFGRPFVARLPAVNKWQVCFQGGSAARLPIPETPSGRRLLGLLGTRRGDVSERYCSAVIAKLSEKGLTTEEIEQLVSRACWEAICKNPGEFTWRTLKRFVNFWRCAPDGIPYYDMQHRSEYYGQTTWEFAKVAGHYRTLLRQSPVHWLRFNEAVTAITCVGTFVLILRRRTRMMGASLACILFYFSAVTSVVEVENYKYRFILEPLMIVAACGWLGIRVHAPSVTDSGFRRPELEDTVPYGMPVQRLEEMSTQPVAEVAVRQQATQTS